MYYPIQIPYILDLSFQKHIKYSETVIDELSDFIICYWDMISLTDEALYLENIIILDGCIDLVVDFEAKVIGFSGMTSTDFHFPIHLPAKFMGLRLMPNAFHQLTGRKPQDALDKLLSIAEIYTDFDCDLFFSLSFEEAREYLIGFISNKMDGFVPDTYSKLFSKFSQDPPSSVSEVCQILNLSQSQCQRNFIKHYGLTPKVVLSILRFQKAITILTSTKSRPSDVLEFVRYYDQSHFINDFKRNIGLTPLELISRYQ
ncbi:helix-turn-helix domain-containing protein [Enterococcus alishanensis]